MNIHNMGTNYSTPGPEPTTAIHELNVTQHPIGSDAVKWPAGKIMIALMYSIMSLAIFFNLRVIYIIVRILSRRQTTSPSRHNAGSNQHAFVYVLSLSIVDSLVLAHMPLVITDIMIGSWIFGEIMCKLYYIAEQVNRTLSTFVLTALSCDRFLAVCYPTRFHQFRTTRSALIVVVLSIFVAALFLTPTYIYSEIREVPVNVTKDTVKYLQKCHFELESSTMSAQYLISTFVICYCIPFWAMVFFYGSILFVLWTKSGTSNSVMNSSSAEFGSSRAERGLKRAQQVTQRALVLVLFYFGCWTPYWIVQFYIEFFSDHENPLLSVQVIIITMLIVHSLCYLNSAVNPFLYALLNKELQQQHSSNNPNERTSFYTTHAQRQHSHAFKRADTINDHNSSMVGRFVKKRRPSVESDPNAMPLLYRSEKGAHENGRRPHVEE